MSSAQVAVSEPQEVLIEGSAELSVGIDEIDTQHQVLLNQLHTAIVRHHAPPRDILHQLLEYTRVHFAVEESLMRTLGYPDYETHKQHHEALIEQVQAMVRKVEAGSTSVSFELMHFLKRWLTGHIMEEDRLYTPFMLSKGVLAESHDKRSWVHKFWSARHRA